MKSSSSLLYNFVRSFSFLLWNPAVLWEHSIWRSQWFNIRLLCLVYITGRVHWSSSPPSWGYETWHLGSLRENVVDEDERDREGIPVPLDRTHHVVPILTLNGLLWWLSGEESACNAGDLSSVSGPGRSLGEGNGNPFQVSCLWNSMDRGAWRVTKELGTTSK